MTVRIASIKIQNTISLLVCEEFGSIKGRGSIQRPNVQSARCCLKIVAFGSFLQSQAALNSWYTEKVGSDAF